MKRDSSPETRRGVNVAGLAMIAVALVLGLLLSAAILQFEGSQRAAAQAAEPPTVQAGAAAQPPAQGAVPAAQPSATEMATATEAPATEAPATEAPATRVPTSKPASSPALAAAAPATATPAAPASSKVGSGTGAPSAGAATGGGSADAGKAIFANTCNSCHPNGQAGLGPALAGRSPAVITRTVRNGKEIMPAFSTAQLSDQQLNDIIAYIQTLK